MTDIDKNHQLIFNLMTHEELLNMTIEYLHLKGFHVAGFRPGMTSRTYKNKKGEVKQLWETGVVGDGKGFPDLLAIRSVSYKVSEVGIEIKTEKDKLSQEQGCWQGWFREARILYLVIKPSDFPDKLERELV